MSTNKIFAVNSLEENELLAVNGGGQEDYNAGRNLGKAVRGAIIDAYDCVSGFVSGLFGN